MLSETKTKKEKYYALSIMCVINKRIITKPNQAHRCRVQIGNCHCKRGVLGVREGMDDGGQKVQK